MDEMFDELKQDGGGQKDWEREWIWMPEFNMENLQGFQSMVVHFANWADRQAFSDLIGRKFTKKTRAIWYPAERLGRFAGTSWKSSLPIHRLTPRYPIYIISKGRWKSRKTARALDAIKVPYQIVVEPQEYDKYADVIDPGKILKLPKENYGGGCSIPARNWVWSHAKRLGADRHWILDDNISGFFRLHNNMKTPVGDGACFRAAENFVDRYENVAIAGFNYFMFAPRKTVQPPYKLNTRIYSCILLRNDLPYEWRGRYNEDTDLSLRALKDGWVTVLFNAFLAFKETTMSMKGGNTESLYAQGGGFDGRLEMAKSLKAQHPAHVTISRKWDRWQHHVDYSRFLQKLKRKPDIDKEKMKINFEMRLKVVDEKKAAWMKEGE